MAGLWYVITPEAGTNYVLNPSAEAADNFGLLLGSPSQSPSASTSTSPSASASPSASQSRSPSASASTSASKSASPSASISPSASVSPSPSASAGLAGVTRVTTHARAGDYCWYVNGGDAYGGLTLTLSALTNAAHYVSFYVRGTITGELQASLDGVHYTAAAIIGGATGGWVRYGVALPASEASGSTALRIRNSADEDYYVDCAQVEATTYATTYIDGDAGPLYRWSGLRHGSTSTRDAQDRGGGRIRNFQTDYSVEVMEGTRRIGMPAIQHNLVGQALQPGAAYQSYKIMPREIELTLMYEGSGWANFHSLRQTLIDLFKPELVRGAQPVLIGYAGADSGTVLWGAFRYSGGLEFGDFMAYNEKPSIRLLAVDPFWYEDNRETAALDFTDSVANSAYANRRTNGQWLALGSGMDNSVAVVVVDKQRGRVYFGGSLTTANGVTVNGVCYWNGTTFVAMDGGVNGTVATIAIAANGDVWVGGGFTTVGSGAAATKGLARWNISTGTWTAFNESTATFGAIRSIAINSTGQVVIAGIFTDWETDGGSDYVCKTDDNGANWDSMGTQPFTSTQIVNNHNGMTFDAAGNLFAGSANTGGGTGSLFKWDGSAWTTIGTTDSASFNGIYSLFSSPDGRLYVGGQYTTLGGITLASISVYNGTSFAPLGSGVSGGIVYVIQQGGDGLVLVGGTFSSAGGSSLADYVSLWNGSIWTQLDIDLPSTPIVKSIAFNGSDILLGYGSTGTATAAGLTTITPTATAPVYPSFTLIGPSSSSATLQWLENQSTGHRLYFNLTVYAGETIKITLTPGARQVVSDWRGVIANQPLSNSDWAAWHLLGSPASNVVAAFVTGTTTAAALLCHYQPRHLSADGPA